MGEKIELFQGVLRFSLFWGVVDLVLVGHFFWSWYRSWQKTGWVVDFWWTTLFLQFFLFILLMYPFNASVFNAPATLFKFGEIDCSIDKAFSLSTLGYLCLWIGRYLHDLPKRRVHFNPFSKTMAGMERMIEHNVASNLCCWTLFFFTLALFTIPFCLSLKEGHLFSARDYFQQTSVLRPIFNLSLCCFFMTIWYMGIHYHMSHKRRYFFLLFILLFLSCFLGARAAFLSSTVFVFSYGVFANRGRVALWKIALCGCMIFCMALFLLGLRSNMHDPFLIFVGFWANLLYGNNFSDTRDFAWILTYWDGDFQYGKTYLAALLSFLPRFSFPFRDEWSYGAYTANVVGLNPLTHAGLRSGPFGEVYLNFGVIGVVVLGTIGGYVLRRADIRLKEAICRESNVIKGYASTVGYFLLSQLFNTAGFWFVYFFLFMNLTLSLINRRTRSTLSLPAV